MIKPTYSVDSRSERSLLPERQLLAFCLGLTGGIATGKSTFAKAFASLTGAELFCADRCVHDLLENDAGVAREICSRIHPLAYHDDATPDRALIREQILAHPEKKAALEEILHPRVRMAWQADAARCRSGGKAFVADIPLLFEVGAESFFDAVITVACSEATRLHRLLARAGMNEAIAKKMIASQWPTDTKVQLSQHVVWNDGLLEALHLQADFLARTFDARSAFF